MYAPMPSSWYQRILNSITGTYPEFFDTKFVSQVTIGPRAVDDGQHACTRTRTWQSTAMRPMLTGLEVHAHHRIQRTTPLPARFHTNREATAR